MLHAAAEDAIASHEVQSIVEGGHGVLEVEDVDLVPLTEQIRCHFGAPVAGLVAEVHTGLQHLTHGNASHGIFLVLRV